MWMSSGITSLNFIEVTIYSALAFILFGQVRDGKRTGCALCIQLLGATVFGSQEHKPLVLHSYVFRALDVIAYAVRQFKPITCYRSLRSYLLIQALDITLSSTQNIWKRVRGWTPIQGGDPLTGCYMASGVYPDILSIDNFIYLNLPADRAFWTQTTVSAHKGVRIELKISRNISA